MMGRSVGDYRHDETGDEDCYSNHCARSRGNQILYLPEALSPEVVCDVADHHRFEDGTPVSRRAADRVIDELG
jgi:hypothetical protein